MTQRLQGLCLYHTLSYASFSPLAHMYFFPLDGEERIWHQIHSEVLVVMGVTPLSSIYNLKGITARVKKFLVIETQALWMRWASLDETFLNYPSYHLPHPSHSLTIFFLFSLWPLLLSEIVYLTHIFIWWLSVYPLNNVIYIRTGTLSGLFTPVSFTAQNSVCHIIDAQ